jgi:hypothetical protein
MERKTRLIAFILALLIILAATLTACKSAASTTPTTSTPTGPGGGGAVINSDSIVTAKLVAIRKQSSSNAWELDVLIESSVDVGSLPNPTKESVGKVITVRTDQDMTPFKVNDVVTARVKYAGDVPKPGIFLYMYNIAPEIKP